MSKKWQNLNSSSSSNNSNQNDLVIDYFFEPNSQTMPIPINADFPIGTFSIDDDYSTMSTVRNVAQSVENGVLMSSPPSNLIGNLSSSLPSDNSGYDSSTANQGARETGIIEKLLHSYGFIQCCDRQARLFFHFSQFSGNIEHLKIGDPVEFEMTYDRRTGKPIASFVSKISPEAVMREERVTGSVTTETFVGINGDVQQGRISYENRGECFFLPFTKDDVEGNVCLIIGDKVSFQIATNNKGNLGARNIRLENATHPIKYRGIVCSLKDNFGFIERADVVKEIFFHISETQHDISPGDHVEFIIQTRAGKEIACNLEKLPPGSVVLEDISDEIMKGQVLKPIDRKELQTMLPNGLTIGNSENYMGRIRYRASDHSEMEISFGYKDQVGDFTLRHGDWVKFHITTDRRDQLQRATMIELMPDSFNVSGEKREQGTVDKICECFGFLRCTDRENRVFFHFSELLEPKFGEPKLGDEFEFTVLSDSSNKQQKFNAIRLLKLEPGTVKFEILLLTQINGVIIKDIFHNTFFNNDDFGDLLNSQKNPLVYNPFDQINLYSGLITYLDENCMKNTITYYLKDCDASNNLPTLGDKVVFNISQVKATKEFIATNVRFIETVKNVSIGDGSQNGLRVDQFLVPDFNSAVQTEPVDDTENNTGRKDYQIGFITQTFKENFGFIETLDQKDEVFFHYSHFDGDINKIKCGEAVEYVLSENTRNLVNDRGFTANYVRFVDPDSIKKPEIDAKVYKGIVQRALRHFNSDQNEYSGLIEIMDTSPMNLSGEQLQDTDEILSSPIDKGSGVFYHYGMMSLMNKSDIIQVNNHVNFQLDSENRVCNLALVKKWFKSKVDAIKGDFGFLMFEVTEGRKLFFHMSEVKDGAELKVGDNVKFYIVKSIRTGKCSAHNIIKLETKNKKERPERLINRLRNVSVSESGPKLTIIRQPKGPDNDSKGFSPTFRSMHFPREVHE